MGRRISLGEIVSDFGIAQDDGNRFLQGSGLGQLFAFVRLLFLGDRLHTLEASGLEVHQLQDEKSGQSTTVTFSPEQNSLSCPKLFAGSVSSVARCLRPAR